MDTTYYDTLVNNDDISGLRTVLIKDMNENIIAIDDSITTTTFEDRLLYLAKNIIELNKINMMEMLICEFHYDVSYKNYLIFSSGYLYRNADMMILLLNHSNINLSDSNNKKVYQIMSEACESENSEIVRILLQNGVDPNSHDGKYLITAIDLNDLNIVKLLIESGANVTCNDNEPLYQAIKSMNCNMIRLLLQAGASMDSVNKRFYKKQKTKRKEFIDLLIDNNIALEPWINFLLGNQIDD